ncbi:hypothetical protein BCU86_23245 [Vibrio lentus]|nr:hypothetical protein A6E08_22580 [Vibrio lentus]PMG73022.1 hypothetical protein BCU86_23245 [Vibrio lentus]PMI57725.1 hypothetical protein BCU41_06225 [Vibrio lentus]PMI84922.1 hypothetical protein BCU36_05240 [Vibrio lentus]PMI89874.1 hypothetical protein BCU35_22755 [Vibrio lentus]
MGTPILVIVAAIALLLLILFWPLVKLRLQTRKVKMTLKGKDGATKTHTLYLEKNEPLWGLIEQCKKHNEGGQNG